MTDIHANFEFQFAGRYRIEAFKADADGNEIPGTRRVAADWFDNLITNAGLNLFGSQTVQIGSNGSWLYACGVGSGSTTPANTDTALVSQVARTTTKQLDQNGAAGAAPYYGWRRITYRFGTGVAAGNLSEVGIFSASSGGTCCSRALIVDGGGTPTTITVLADETLDVLYELRMYAPTSDASWGPVTISGISYSGTVRASLVTSSVYWAPGVVSPPSIVGLWGRNASSGAAAQATATATLAAVTSQPSGTGFPETSKAASAYTPGTYARTQSLTWAIADGNTGSGIGTIWASTTVGAFQMNFSPVLAKDATKTLTLNFTISWGRYTP